MEMVFVCKKVGATVDTELDKGRNQGATAWSTGTQRKAEVERPIDQGRRKRRFRDWTFNRDRVERSIPLPGRQVRHSAWRKTRKARMEKQ